MFIFRTWRIGIHTITFCVRMLTPSPLWAMFVWFLTLCVRMLTPSPFWVEQRRSSCHQPDLTTSGHPTGVPSSLWRLERHRGVEVSGTAVSNDRSLFPGVSLMWCSTTTGAPRSMCWLISATYWLSPTSFVSACSRTLHAVSAHVSFHRRHSRVLH